MGRCIQCSLAMQIVSSGMQCMLTLPQCTSTSWLGAAVMHKTRRLPDCGVQCSRLGSVLHRAARAQLTDFSDRLLLATDGGLGLTLAYRRRGE